MMEKNEKALLIGLADAVLDAIKFILDSPFTPLQAKKTAANMEHRIRSARDQVAG